MDFKIGFIQQRISCKYIYNLMRSQKCFDHLENAFFFFFSGYTLFYKVNLILRLYDLHKKPVH
jgi:hypothetical protein